ncbi:MAG: 23S rRNA (uracil(1939)-C(5))-methyltransferase RlmD [Bacteroidales bacterium]
MARKRNPLPLFEKVEIIDAGSEGKAVARIDEKVIFIPYVMPGDVVDIQVVKRKKSFFEGKAVKFHKYSDDRVDAACKHFGLCGGCKWQHMPYEKQLFYKQKQVVDNVERIGKFEHPGISDIIGSEKKFYYRNKLEFTFSDRKWFIEPPKDPDNIQNPNGLGFHLPGMFDRILDIEHCVLQKDPSNAIRLALKDYAIANNLSFYNPRKNEGFLRNLVIRTSSTGDLMVIVIFGYKDEREKDGALAFLKEKFPEITSLMYVINKKLNDSFSDLKIHLYNGNDYIMEEMQAPIENMEPLKFKVGPVSFYQTNSAQAYTLYQKAFDLAQISSEDLVYDLYTGTGTIANFVARSAKKVIGIEYVPQAINDAKENSSINKIDNTDFFAGDMVKVLNDDFIKTHGQPDIIITDPPRAGMHDKVVKQIIKVKPQKVVYISCNPATQARDVALMTEHYKVSKIQPVDMFPQTHHVENIILLERK